MIIIVVYLRSMFEFLVHNTTFHTILISILSGAIIGVEREYKNKSAGFRTVILICLGSTIYTLASRMGDISDDRVAANIVTGIGFLGAGVIYQGRFSVQGLTTAAVIWTTAAIGMIIGFGQFYMGIGLALGMVIVLSVFQKIETLMSDLYVTRIIHITFIDNDVSRLEDFQNFLAKHKVNVIRKGLEKDENRIGATYEISGNRQLIRIVNESAIGLSYIYMYNNQ